MWISIKRKNITIRCLNILHNTLLLTVSLLLIFLICTSRVRIEDSYVIQLNNKIPLANIEIHIQC